MSGFEGVDVAGVAIEFTEQRALERLAAWSVFAGWVEQAELVEAESLS